MRTNLTRLAVALAAAATVLAAAAPAGAAPAGAGPDSHRTDRGAQNAAGKAAPAVPAPRGRATSARVPAKPAPSAARPAGPYPWWDAFAWQVTLTASTYRPWTSRLSTLTATANADVGRTPYYIRIYRLGVQIASCPSGTTCAIAVARPTPQSDYFWSEIVDNSGNVKATSPGWVWVSWHGDTTLALAASPTTLPVDGTSTLTATSGDDVGPSPYFIEIFDATTAARLKTCGGGTTCSVDVSQSAASTHAYQAFVAPSSTHFPPDGAVATSSTSYVTWTPSGYHLGLTAPVTLSTVLVTATSSVDVGPTPYYIEIFNEDTGGLLTSCGTGTTCTVTFTPTDADSHLVAFIASQGSSLPPANIKASSNVAITALVHVPAHRRSARAGR
jgi:hypothetical protein